VQQLQCVSYLAHGDPWCGHSWVPVKKPASLRLVWVTQDTAGVSAFKMECCPPSPWNGARDYGGTLSAISMEPCQEMYSQI
jgi:hypothetical protein